ncbi:MAG: hypothetical protein EOO88_58330 [Pedobacter sp.]|nr:MAG: hypothetical protein EOO88_58330 [Pedobacter sp.]
MTAIQNATAILSLLDTTIMIMVLITSQHPTRKGIKHVSKTEYSDVKTPKKTKKSTDYAQSTYLRLYALMIL